MIRGCFKLKTKLIFWINVYVFNFFDVYFAIIEENISKKKKEYLSCNDRPEIGQPLLYKGHRTRRTLSKITKKPKSFRQWNFATNDQKWTLACEWISAHLRCFQAWYYGFCKLSSNRATYCIHYPGGGGNWSINDGGTRRSFILPTQKVHEPEILHPKNTWHQSFLPAKIRRSLNPDLFSKTDFKT